jgi:hypothetical protein
MQHSPKDIKKHLQAQRKSGLSIHPYCQHQGLNYWTFREWRKRRFPAVRSSVAPQFVKLDVPQSSFPEIVTGTNATIRISAQMDAVALRQILCAVKHSRIE